jgi:hypothetical protein
MGIQRVITRQSVSARTREFKASSLVSRFRTFARTREFNASSLVSWCPRELANLTRHHSSDGSARSREIANSQRLRLLVRIRTFARTCEINALSLVSRVLHLRANLIVYYAKRSFGICLMLIYWLLVY